MAPSFDCFSSLLCDEDITVFDDDDYGVAAEEEEYQYHHQKRSQQFGDKDALPTLLSEECLAMMMEKECQHCPGSDYLNKFRSGDLDFEARNEAIDWIQKARMHFGFGPLCSYLSINFLDRFLSAYELPKGKAWTMQLLAVACLSLAAKIEETDVPLNLDLQLVESKFVFEAKTIQRMELLVLSTLKWRMQAITPFSFIDYFLRKIDDDNDDDGSLLSSSISRSTRLILNTTKGIEFLAFKPSEIAAAVAMCVVVGEENQSVETDDKRISILVQHVEKERLVKCVELIHELSLSSNKDSSACVSTPCVPHTPIGVLDAECFGYKRDVDTNACSSASSDDRTDAKRRKLN